LTMRRTRCLLSVGLGLAGVFLAVNMARGAGFALYEGSARGNALGGTLVGRADDPSALFYNPAGMTQLPGLQVVAGATAIVPKTDVVTTDGGADARSETKTNCFVPPHFYSTYQYTDSVWFGLGVFPRFGLGTEFDADWPGRYNSYNAAIETLTVNPNVAFKVNDKLSLAGGVSWMWFDLTLEQKIDFGSLNSPDPDTNALDVDQSLTGDNSGYGFNLALHYKALDRMSLGVSYVSRTKQEIKGEADFSKPAGVPSTVFNDTKASGKITLPDILFLGAVFYPVDRLSLELDGVWTRWSTYDELTIHYRDPILPGVKSITKEKKWDDVWRVQIGVEYKALDWLDLRLGYVYDDSPIPRETADYLVPANDRHLYNFGCGLHWGQWTADLSYTYLDIESRSVSPRPEDGVLDSRFKDSHAHLIGSSVSYNF
jgi:long-chain fatty acid transport protein